MHFEDLQCKITRDPVFNGVSIVFYTKAADGQIYVVKPMKMELATQDPYAAVEPTLQLPGSSGESFLKSMAEALDNQGIKTSSDDKIAGTLEATKYHLEDMRGLLAWFTQQDEGSSHGD